jgi:hypothetical protein
LWRDYENIFSFELYDSCIIIRSGYSYIWWYSYTKTTVAKFRRYNCTGTHLFLDDENIFQNSACVVALLLQFLMQPREPIFEKCSHLGEKGEVLIFPLGLYDGVLYGQNLR